MLKILVLTICLVLFRSNFAQELDEDAIKRLTFALSFETHTTPEKDEVVRIAPSLPKSRGQSPAPQPPKGATPYVVRCPYGWVADGAHCSTIVTVKPYTQCPDFAKLFKRGLASVMTSKTAGICDVVDSTGPILSCPHGFRLTQQQLSAVYDVSSEWSIKSPPEPWMLDATFPAFSSRSYNSTTTVSDDDDFFATYGMKKKRKLTKAEGPRSNNGASRFNGRESEKTWKCIGYSIAPSAQMTGKQMHSCTSGYTIGVSGCETIQVVPPEVKCPTNFTIGGQLVDPDAWRGKQFVLCSRITKFKGMALCPNGFVVSSELYSSFNFGERIPKDAPIDILEHGMKNIPSSQYRTDPICLQAVAVFYNRCKRFKCESPHLKELEKTVRQWAYYKNDDDPKRAAFLGMPSGNDLRYTVRGVTAEGIVSSL